MEIHKAYNIWSEQYDTNKNKTRDLEALALRKTLARIPFTTCLEMGCGTGKNTEWLLKKAKQIVAVDFSEGMLAVARQKITSDRVKFYRADINQHWSFVKTRFNLVTFSLVLEHIENLHAIFQKAAEATVAGGYVYVGELHPFKQYGGTKARFDSENGRQELTCFTHHLSEFTQAAKQNGFQPEDINEFFDKDNTRIPRILTLLFKKSAEV